MITHGPVTDQKSSTHESQLKTTLNIMDLKITPLSIMHQLNMNSLTTIGY